MGFMRQLPSGLFIESTTPIARIDVQNGLGESPSMASKVHRSVLSFAIGIVGRRMEEPYTQRFGARVVAVDVGKAHHDGMAGGRAACVPSDNGGTLTVRNTNRSWI